MRNMHRAVSIWEKYAVVPMREMRSHNIRPGRGCFLVVVGTTEVVAAVRADQLASMADEPMRARRADLAVVLDGLIIAHGTDRTTL